MSARRGLNLAYARLVENMDKDERTKLDSEISLSLIELQVMRAAEKEREKRDRQRLAASLGEVG